MTTSVPRHSELWQKYRMRKQGGSNMTQSEESVTLMTFYRFPHRGSRFFANIHNGAFCPVSPVTAALCRRKRVAQI